MDHKKLVVALFLLIACGDDGSPLGGDASISLDARTSGDGFDFVDASGLRDAGELEGLEVNEEGGTDPSDAPICYSCCVGSTSPTCCVAEETLLVNAACATTSCEGFASIGAVNTGDANELLLAGGSVRSGLITSQPIEAAQVKTKITVDFVYGDCQDCVQQVAVSLGSFTDLEGRAELELSYSRSRNQVSLLLSDEPIWTLSDPIESTWTLSLGTEGQVELINGTEVFNVSIGTPGTWFGRVFGSSRNPSASESPVGIRSVIFETELCDAPAGWALRSQAELVDFEQIREPANTSAATFDEVTVLAFEAGPQDETQARQTFLAIVDGPRLQMVSNTYPITRPSIVATASGYRLLGVLDGEWTTFEGVAPESLRPSTESLSIPVTVADSVGPIAQVVGLNGVGYIWRNVSGQLLSQIQLTNGTTNTQVLRSPDSLGDTFETPVISVYRRAYQVGLTARTGLRSSAVLMSSDDLLTFTPFENTVLEPREGMFDQIGISSATFVEKEGLHAYYVADDGVRKSLGYAFRRLNSF